VAQGEGPEFKSQYSKKKKKKKELHVERQYTNNKGTQWAICWGPGKQKLSQSVLHAGTKALSGAAANFPRGQASSPPTWSPTTQFPLLLERPPFELVRAPAEGLPRNRYPIGKIYWNPATAHRGHRKQVTIWQHYYQGAAPSTLPEAERHLNKTLRLVHNYSL
jgi:hypothetical protein